MKLFNAPLLLLALSLFSLAGCKKSDSASPSSGGHGTITYDGKSADFAVAIVSASSGAKAVGGNAYGTDNSYSVAFTLISPPASGGDIALGTSGGAASSIIVLQVTAKSGGTAVSHYFGVSGEKLHYTTGSSDTYSATDLTEINISDGTPIASAPKLTFTLKQ